MAAEPEAELARAKVNLFLHVTGRRPDGYHLLESLVVFPAIGDRLEADAAARLSLSIDGPFAALLDAGADNLVIRAAEALGPGRGAALKLTKNLPVAAGIGGGSADAGAALRLLGRLWGAEGAARVASGLGADAPMCLAQTPALVSGVGERLTPAPAFPGFALLLVNPLKGLSTPEVFGALASRENPPAPAPPPAFASVADLADWLGGLRNDLEPPAIARMPVIADILAAIDATEGRLLARMSGSGATCFGLYGDMTAAMRAAERIRTAAPAWWVAAAPVEGWRRA